MCSCWQRCALLQVCGQTNRAGEGLELLWPLLGCPGTGSVQNSSACTWCQGLEHCPEEFSAGPFCIPEMKCYQLLPSVKHTGSSRWAPAFPSGLLLWLSLAGSSMQVAWRPWGRLMENTLHPFPSLWRYFWLQQFAEGEACFPLFLVYPFAQWGGFLL